MPSLPLFGSIHLLGPRGSARIEVRVHKPRIGFTLFPETLFTSCYGWVEHGKKFDRTSGPSSQPAYTPPHKGVILPECLENIVVF